MDILKPIKTLIERGKSKVKNKMDMDKMFAEATILMEEYASSDKEKTQWNDKFDREEKIYVGDRTFGNIRTENSKDDARTPVRISQSIIEAQIDLSIPEAVFKPIAADDEEAVRKLQAEADYTIRSSDLDEINSSAERTVKKHGIAVYKVLWDNNYQGAGFTGRPEIVEIHPKNITWYPGTVDKNKCPAFYLPENVTLQDCIRKYGDIAKKLPEYGLCADIKYDTVGAGENQSVNKTNDVNGAIDLYTQQLNHPLTKYTIIEKWYIDEDNELGLVTFSDRLILLKKPKFYHRRKFNAENDMFEYDKDGNEILIDEEEISEDIMQDATDDSGNPVKITKISKGTKVPYYYPKGPKSIPIIIQNNIPRSKSIVGISDIERSWDFEQSMKKMIYKHEERILRGSTKILYNKQLEEEAAKQLDNDEINLIGVNDVNNFKPVEFKDNGRETLEFYQFISDQLQYMLGITSVWQGINKGESKSGKMTDSLINQTAEKISIKVNEKNIAYKRIYRLVCDFILCFSDGDRPYRIDSKFKTEYGTFNRQDMIRQDKSGNYIYPDWDIEITEEPAIAKDRLAVIDQTVNLATQGFLDATPRNILFWTIMTKCNFPNAEQILANLQDQLNQMQQMQATPTDENGNPIPQGAGESNVNMDAVMQSLPPEIQAQFAQLSPEEQAAIMNGGQNVA